MRYLTAYYTDKGRRKAVNQDSLLVLREKYEKGEAVLPLFATVWEGWRRAK